MTGHSALDRTTQEQELDILQEFMESGTIGRLSRLGRFPNCSNLVHGIIMTLSTHGKVVTARAMKDLLDRVLADPAWEKYDEEKTG